MVIEDTIHYAPNASDWHEWLSLFPSGEGFVRLGKERRLFGVSMFHQARRTCFSYPVHLAKESLITQMHCLMKIQRAIYEEPPTDFAKWHVSHCMNYLR
jgi:hypothetical protein